MTMLKHRSVFGFLFILLLCFSPDLVAAQGSPSRGSKWQTLNGDAPLVVARGGFSGLFPDSSEYAYQFAVQTGLPNVHAWCDVQLTKDGAGICLPYIDISNDTNIEQVYEGRNNTYIVNGVLTKGYFALDFTLNELGNLSLRQTIFSRSPYFDNILPILTVEDVVSNAQPPGLWLNVQHDAFFSQHNLSMRRFILSVSRRVIVNYLSSPEVNFLRSVASRLRTSPTKLVFQFLGPEDVEPSTNQTYSSLLSNLTLIKTFATGILVPKEYIWPVDNLQYLQNHTSLVLDAHRAGLEVYASNFANDATNLPYDYSYDPVSEYLSFIDNGIFCVDGVLTDFPITPSESIDCFSHIGKNDTIQANVLVISNEGASGDYPGCTDIAYAKAVSDGVHVLDCPVQMTSDGIPFCLGSINLIDRTNAAQSAFINLATTNPQLNIVNGIFAYNLTWSQIQTLTPALHSPYGSQYSLYRNPRAVYEGSLMQLTEFLDFANNASSVSGVLISIENAAYLAENQGFDVIDAVLDALNKSGYNSQTTKKVMIKSSDSAVLSKLKSISSYELVYLVDEDVRDILNSTLLEIKSFATSVVISKRSVFPTDHLFLLGQTDIVPKLQALNLSVYVEYFRNEFVSQPWDFFSDAYVEINSHVSGMGINGVITEFPATAARYTRNRCLGYKDIPVYMNPAQPGALFSLTVQKGFPPAEAPSPILTESDVTEPAFPPVRSRIPITVNGTTTPGPSPGNAQPALAASTILSTIVILIVAIVLR